MATRSATPTAEETPTEATDAVRLDGLPGDLISSIFCVSSSPRDLAACAATCTLFRGLVATGDPWRSLLWRTFDVFDECADPRSLLASFHRRAPQRLALRGFLCDGGVDGWETGESSAGNATTAAGLSEPVLQLRTLPQTTASFWMTNAFLDSDWRVYCSDSSERNISLVAAVVSPDVEAASALERERARRAYMIERLYFVAETLWAWTVNGFGGLRSSNPHPNPGPTRSQSCTLTLTLTLTPLLSRSRRAGQLQHGDAGARDALGLGPASGARPPTPRHMPWLP